MNTIAHKIASQFKSSPDNIALVFGDKELSYEQLGKQVHWLVNHLLAQGIEQGDRVGVVWERSIEWVIGVLALWNIGAVYIPLDPDNPIERIKVIAEDAQLKYLLTTSALIAYVEQLERPYDVINSILAAYNADIQAEHDFFEPVCEPNDLAYIIYTSGSTGKPKGVMIDHANLLSYDQGINAVIQITAADRVLQFCSLSFDLSISEMVPTLVRGATLILRQDDWARSFLVLTRAIEAYKISIVLLPTAFWNGLVESLDQSPQSWINSVRVIYFGGEAAKPQTLIKWRDLFSDCVDVINIYGPTEVTVFATVWNARDWLKGTAPLDRVPIGDVLTTVSAKLLDKNGQELFGEACGELYLGGPQVARGYYNNPEVTAKAFIDEQGMRWYRTGDSVSRNAQGALIFNGRIDHQLKILGFRIEPGEIEHVLRSSSTVREAVVIGNQEASQLIAYIQMVDGEDFDADFFLGFLKRSLPPYMIPAFLIPVKDFALNLNGKIDRKKLPKPSVEKNEKTAPITPLEKMLAVIWQELLGVSAVYKEDDLYYLGGSSLTLIRMLAALESALGTQIPRNVALYKMRTLAEFAQVLTETIDRDASVERAMHSDSKVQQLVQCKPGSMLYSGFLSYEKMCALLGYTFAPFIVPVAMRFTGKLHIPVLEAAINDTVKKHPMLRAILPEKPKPHAKITARICRKILDIPYVTPVIMAIHNFFSLKKDASSKTVFIDIIPEFTYTLKKETQLLHNEAEVSNFLSSAEVQSWLCSYQRKRDPGLSVRLIKIGKNDYLFLSFMDHLISDGQSTMIYIDSIMHAYKKRIMDLHKAPLANEAAHFIDVPEFDMHTTLAEEEYAFFYSNYRKYQTFQNQQHHFYRYNVSEIDNDVSFAYGEETIPFDAILRLRNLAKEYNTTVYAVSLAYLACALSKYTKNDHIPIKCLAANREYDGVKHQIGLYLNKILLVVDASKDSFADSIKSAAEQVEKAQKLQHIPERWIQMKLQSTSIKNKIPKHFILSPNISFDYINLMPKREITPDLSIEEYQFKDCFAANLLQFQLIQKGSHFKVAFLCDPKYYFVEEVQVILKLFASMLLTHTDVG